MITVCPKNYLALLLALSFFQLVFGQSQTPRIQTFPGIENPAFPYAKPEDVGMSSEKLEKLGAEVHQWAINGDLVGGELLMIKNGKTVFHEAYGWADREANRPTERNSIWSIKSMTKPFTTTAVMMLVEEGKLSLDDKLIDFIPEYVGDPRTTIGHLLSHTSGYRKYDYHDPDPTHHSLKDWVMDWATTEPTGTFGQYAYTDFGFAAGGYIVELLTGRSIEDFTEKEIIKPLGLQNTSTGFSDDPAWRARLNAWYRWDFEVGRYHLRWTTNRDDWTIYPAAWGMFSTAMDYAEFLSLYMNQGEWNGTRLLQKETVNNMLQPHGYLNQSPEYGYGWFVTPISRDNPQPLRFGHSGGDGTMGYAYPQEDLMVIFLTHSRDGTHRRALLDRINVLGIATGPPAPGMVRGEDFPDPILPLDANEARDYTGFYWGRVPNEGEDFLIRVQKPENRLQVKFNVFGQETGIFRDLTYLGEDRFAPSQYDEGQLAWANPEVVLHFMRDDEKVVALEILVNGKRDILGQRVEAEEVLAELETRRNRRFLNDLIRKTLEQDGLEAARQLSRELHNTRPDTVGFGEGLLNTLGYQYLDAESFEKATAVFEMNVEAYPEAPNCYDSLADAWRRQGDLEKAQKFYQQAANLAREQGDPRLNGIEARLKEVKDAIQSKP